MMETLILTIFTILDISVASFGIYIISDMWGIDYLHVLCKLICT
jgi:hypothetical protein